MYKKPVIIIFLILFFLTLFLSSFSYAAHKHIYIYGEEVTSQLVPVKENNQIMVKARVLADYIEAEIRWKKSIQTLTLTKNGTVIKMMAGSPYLQIGDRAVKSDANMILVDNQSYVPLKDIARGFGFLINEAEDSLYIFKPETEINEVCWENNGRKLVINMDKITPYRVYGGSDPNVLIIEIDRAALASDFKDNVSNKNYYLDIKSASKTARLQLILKGKYAIPYYNESCLGEEGNNIILNFYPAIEEINWRKDNKLEIIGSDSITEPEFTLLNDPRRIVLDFPDLRLSDYNLNITENKYIKEVRVSQFKYEPFVLRIVLELKENSYLQSMGIEDDSKFILAPAVETEICDLNYADKKISFVSTTPVKPELFMLEDPERLVINILNAVRSDNLADTVEVDNDLITGIRSSRFDDEIIRIVVDLNRKVGYNWKQTQVENGNYQHVITLGNTVEDLNLVDSKQSTDIIIKFVDKVKYKVNKFSYPDRLVIDVSDIDIDLEQIEIPEATGIIEDIRLNKYTIDGEELTRFVFTLNQYNAHNIISENPGNNISVTLDKEIAEEIDKNNLIIIDAGHGGFDPGAIGASGLTEKEVNLNIAHKVREKLEKEELNVMLTRENDIFISLKERVRIANEAGGRIFVSIHNNASSKNHSEGTETFLAPGRDGECLLLAELIQEELIAELNLFDRGVKRDNFYVIKYTEMPAVLVEVAFLSNSHEESLLESDLFCNKAAEAIARGIKKYIERVN